MRPIAFALFAAFALLTAGCLASTEEQPPATNSVKLGPLDPFVDKHNHTDPAEHRDAIHNMELLGWNPLVPYGKNTGAHAVDIWENYLFVQTNGEVIGFFILDVSDPANPVEVGRYEDPNVRAGDRTLMVSEDGKYVFVGSEAKDNAGVYAIDISDMSAPKKVAYYKIAYGGSHTLFAKMVDGKYYVYALNFGVHILRLDDSPLGGKQLTLVGRYMAATAEQLSQAPKADDSRAYLVRDIYAHDLFVDVDPVTKQVLLYVAHAYEGLKIVDITNPMLPKELSTFVPKDAHSPYYVHTVWVSHIGDRRILVLGSEVFENRHTDVPSPVWILDVTDLKSPQLLSTWVNPGGHGSQALLYSAHDFRIENGRLYLSHYHGGIWVLDISTPELQAAPKVLGYYAASEDNGYRPPANCCLGFNMAAMPLYFDVTVKDGIAYGADWFTGIHVLRLQNPDGVPHVE